MRGILSAAAIGLATIVAGNMGNGARADTVDDARAALAALAEAADQASDTEDRVRDALATLAVQARLASLQGRDIDRSLLGYAGYGGYGFSRAEFLQSFPLQSVVQTQTFSVPVIQQQVPIITQTFAVPQIVDVSCFNSRQRIRSRVVQRNVNVNRIGRRVQRQRIVNVQRGF